MADKDSYEQLNDEQQTEGDICDKPPPAFTISVKDPVEGMKQPFIQQPVMQPQPSQQHPVIPVHSNASDIVIVPATQPQQPQAVQYYYRNTVTGALVPIQNAVQQPAEPYEDLICISCLVCLLCNWICGLFALAASSNAQDAYRRGDYAEYRRQRSYTKMCIAISCCAPFVCGLGLYAGIQLMCPLDDSLCPSQE
eukprot:230424_1